MSWILPTAAARTATLPRDLPRMQLPAPVTVHCGEAVLPLRRAEVRRGDAERVVGGAAFGEYRSHQKRLRHRGAGAVLSEIRRAVVHQTKGRSGTLVEQVAGKHRVQLLRTQVCLFHAQPRRLLLQTAFRLLKGLAPAAAVVFCFVKQRAERSLGLLFSDDGRKALHTRHILKQKRSRSQFFYHKKTSANSISRGFGIMMLFLR